MLVLFKMEFPPIFGRMPAGKYCNHVVSQRGEKGRRRQFCFLATEQVWINPQSLKETFQVCQHKRTQEENSGLKCDIKILDSAPVIPLL